MNDPGRRELEELLRSALNDAAARIHPAGDGLERIRERASRRRRRLRWVRPVLAVATATAAAALATTVPLYLHSTGGSADRAIGSASGTKLRPTLTRTPTGPSPADPTGSPAPEVSQVPSPTDSSAAALPDMVTVWPYASREEGSQHADQDVADQVHPALRDPRATALDFIRSFVGDTDDLVADSGTSLEAGIAITVSRKVGGGLEPVSVVYLVRVRKADDAPYVVVDARLDHATNSLTIQPGTLEGTEPISVRGVVTELISPTPVAAIKVELHEPGDSQTLASGSPSLILDPVGEEQNWSTTLTPVRRLNSSTGTVAAWTVDAQNHLLAFTAVATATDFGGAPRDSN